jgi:hypothetical protein
MPAQHQYFPISKIIFATFAAKIPPSQKVRVKVKEYVPAPAAGLRICT